ncbi:MAG: roadblock/LC7 domain-containing protein [Acidimicrobiia bacterium]
MTKADLLAAALDDFLAVSPDVEAAAVVSADGLPMASALPPYVEEDRLAAMSAALLTLGERAAAGLGKGELAQVFVEGAQGYVVLMSAGRNAVLVAVTSKETKVGLILYEMRKTSARVASVMDEDISADQLAQAAMDRAATAITTPSEAPVEQVPATTDSAWTEPAPVEQVQATTDSAWTEPAPVEDSAWASATVVHEEFGNPEPAQSWDSEELVGDSFQPDTTVGSEEFLQPEESFQPEPSLPAEESFQPEAPPPVEEVQPQAAEPEVAVEPQQSGWETETEGQEKEDEKKETRVTGWH